MGHWPHARVALAQVHPNDCISDESRATAKAVEDARLESEAMEASAERLAKTLRDAQECHRVQVRKNTIQATHKYRAKLHEEEEAAKRRRQTLGQ